MPDFKGVAQFQEADGDPTIILDGDNGDVTVGGSNQDGQLLVTTGAGATRVSIDGATGTVTILAADGDPLVTIDGSEGDIIVHRKTASVNHDILRFNAADAELLVGGQGNEGDVGVRDAANQQRIRLD